MSKQFKLSIAIPTSGMVPMAFAYSLAALIGTLQSKGLPSCPEYTDISIDLDVLQSSIIHANRESLVERAIKNDFTHLLFLDDDMQFDPNIVDLLASRRKDVVVTNYMIKRDDKVDFVAVDLLGHRVPTKKESSGLCKVSYSGFGVSLFNLDVFKNTPKPWFLPEYDIKDGYSSEDNACLSRISRAGFPVFLDQDASKLVSHCGQKMWSYGDVEWIE